MELMLLLRNVGLTSLWVMQMPMMLAYSFDGNQPLMYAAMVKMLLFSKLLEMLFKRDG